MDDSQREREWCIHGVLELKQEKAFLHHSALYFWGMVSPEPRAGVYQLVCIKQLKIMLSQLPVTPWWTYSSLELYDRRKPFFPTSFWSPCFTTATESLWRHPVLLFALMRLPRVCLECSLSMSITHLVVFEPTVSHKNQLFEDTLTSTSELQFWYKT